MPFEFVQIPANGQGGGTEVLNRLLRGGRIVSVRKEFAADGERSYWAFCVECVEGGDAGGRAAWLDRDEGAGSFFKGGEGAGGGWTPWN